MRTVAPLALAVALSGCALMVPKLATPKLSLVDIEVQTADFWQQRLRVRVRVGNPNDRALRVRGFSYTLYLGGEKLATGASDAGFVVPARGNAEFNMYVTANLVGPLLTILARGRASVDYHLTGKVELACGWLRSLPFAESGKITLRRDAGVPAGARSSGNGPSRPGS